VHDAQVGHLLGGGDDAHVVDNELGRQIAGRGVEDLVPVEQRRQPLAGFQQALQAEHLVGEGLGVVLGLGKQAGVVQGDGDLVGQRGQDGHVLIGEGARLARLHIQRTEHLPARDQGDGHLRARIRQVGVGAVDDLRVGGVQGDHRLGAGSHLPDHGIGADRQRPVEAEQGLAGFASAGLEHGVLPRVVQQEDLGMVVLERVADQVHDARQQLVDIQDGDRGAADLGRGLQLAGAVLGLAQQAEILQGDGRHLRQVLVNAQLARAIAARARCAEQQRAGGRPAHLQGSNDQRRNALAQVGQPAFLGDPPVRRHVVDRQQGWRG